MSEKKPCALATEGCPEDATPKTPYCKNCNHVFYYWEKLPAARRMRRQLFLKKSQARMRVVDSEALAVPVKIKIKPPATAKPAKRVAT